LSGLCAQRFRFSLSPQLTENVSRIFSNKNKNTYTNIEWTNNEQKLGILSLFLSLHRLCFIQLLTLIAGYNCCEISTRNKQTKTTWRVILTHNATGSNWTYRFMCGSFYTLFRLYARIYEWMDCRLNKKKYVYVYSTSSMLL
jgi:hypothetical protein